MPWEISGSRSGSVLSLAYLSLYILSAPGLDQSLTVDESISDIISSNELSFALLRMTQVYSGESELTLPLLPCRLLFRLLFLYSLSPPSSVNASTSSCGILRGMSSCTSKPDISHCLNVCYKGLGLGSKSSTSSLRVSWCTSWSYLISVTSKQNSAILL